MKTSVFVAITGYGWQSGQHKECEFIWLRALEPEKSRSVLPASASICQHGGRVTRLCHNTVENTVRPDRANTRQSQHTSVQDTLLAKPPVSSGRTRHLLQPCPSMLSAASALINASFILLPQPNAQSLPFKHASVLQYHMLHAITILPMCSTTNPICHLFGWSSALETQTHGNTCGPYFASGCPLIF